MPVIWPDMIPETDHLGQPRRRLKVPAGTDEIAHGGDRFPVDAFGGNIVTVPNSVAAVLLRTGAGVELADKPVIEEPSGETIRVRHATDSSASFTWKGCCCTPDESGCILAPAEAVPHLLSHGFRPIEPKEQ